MPALLMCGGRGMRLRPLTYAIPKPLLPLGEKPILEWIIEHLRRCGVVDLFLAVGYRGELLETYFRDGSPFGVKIRYLRESQPLGTAGALVSLKGLVTEPFLMMNGDVLTRLDFRTLMDVHRGTGADLTVCVRRHTTQIPFGIVRVQDGVIQGIEEKPVVESLINAGIYALSPSLFTLLPQEGHLDMPQLIERAIASGLTVRSFLIQEDWIDIGEMQEYERANQDVARWLGDDSVR